VTLGGGAGSVAGDDEAGTFAGCDGLVDGMVMMGHDGEEDGDEEGGDEEGDVEEKEGERWGWHLELVE